MDYLVVSTMPILLLAPVSVVIQAMRPCFQNASRIRLALISLLGLHPSRNQQEYAWETWASLIP